MLQLLSEKGRVRILRTFQHIAQKEHWCDRCMNYIFPGECYEGMVSVSDRGYLIVNKTHIYPTCDYPDDPDYDKYNKDQDSNPEEVPLPLAA